MHVPQVKFAHDLASNHVVVSYGVVTAGKYDAGSVAADVLKIDQNAKGFISSFAFEVSKHRCYERELDGLVDMVAY